MKHLALLLAGVALSSATLQAQSSSDVPDSHRPPPGMCRIWIDGVPPTHQPAPTDCATAIRKRPMNARVVFGIDARSGSPRTVAPDHPGQSNFVAPSAPTVSHEEQGRIAQRQEQERQRIAAQQEQQRIEAQRVRDEQEKRAAHHDAPPTQHGNQDHAAPSPRPRSEHQPRPPHSSSSARRPR